MADGAYMMVWDSATSSWVKTVSSSGVLSVNVANQSEDMFEQVVTAGRYNQVEISFDQTDPDLIAEVTVTKTSGGDAVNSGGQAVFSTGTNTNGGIKCVTNSTVAYRPNAEIYADFSCVYSAGLANSYQRIGCYDANNGFFIGYEGTSFGVTIRKAGVDTTTPRTSFNIDKLTGDVNSKFTRNGVPEALDPAKDNLYRIRFGWLGAAPVIWEVMSPDGKWVIFHIYRHPNTVAATSINDPDLPITLDAQKTGAGATNLTISTACWAVGTSSDLQKVSSTLTDNTLVKPVRSVLVAKMPNGSYTNIDATAGGNLKVSLEEVDGAVTIPVSGTVTANLAAGTNYAGKVRLTDGTTDAEVVPLTGYNAQAVAIVDGSGNQITSFGGGVQYTEGDTDATITGTAMLFETNTGTSALGVVSATNPLPVSDNGTTLSIDDGGSSITVDGTVAATQSGTWVLGANSGVDIGDVTINNASIAVTGTFWQATQPVSIASAVAVTDNSGSLTVDAPVATPVFVRLSDGASAISTLPVSLATVPSHAVTNAGTFAVQVDGAALTSLQLLDDTVATAGSAALTKLNQVGGTDGTNARILSTNASGHLNIADGGNSITVDGTFWQATQPVSIAAAVAVTDNSGSLTVDNGGTFVVQENGAALTALQLLDDVVVTDNAGFTDGTTKLAMAGYIYDEVAGTALTENDAAAGRINANRAVVNALEDGTTRGRYATVTASNALKVDGSAVTQPVSGTFWQATQPVSNAGTFAVQAAQSGTWSVRAQDGSGNNLTSATRGSERALSVQIVDGSGTQITSFGGGTQYAEDAASAGGESLTLAGAIRQDTPASSTSLDGDYSNLKTDSVGRLWVNASGAAVPVTDNNTTLSIDDGGGSITVDGTFWQATQPVSIAASVAVTDNSGSLTVDAPVGTPVFVRLSDGASAISTLPVSLASVPSHPVTNAGTFAVQVDGAALTSLQLLDDTVATAASAALTKLYQVGGTDGTNARVLSTNTSGHVNIADGGNSITVDNAGTFVVQENGSALTALQLLDDTIIADDAAFTVGTTKVNMAGGYAVAHGANPDAADAGDAGAILMNRHRIPFMLGGHPNLQSAEYITTAAQTNDNVLPLISAGTKYVITGITVTASAANSVNTSVRLGFGTTGVPAQGASGADAVTKVVLSHPNIAAGSGVVKGHAGGIVGVGGDGEELYITCSVPTGGSLVVQVDYFTIES